MSTPDDEPIRFDTKIAVLLRDDLEPWQRLNVTAFLVSGLGATVPEVVGEPYADADGVPYLPMFRQPVMIFEGGKETLTAAHGRALVRALPRAVFTSDLFATGNDRDNRAAVRAVPTAALDLVGLAVYGPRNRVDKVFKGVADASLRPGGLAGRGRRGARGAPARQVRAGSPVSARDPATAEGPVAAAGPARVGGRARVGHHTAKKGR